MNADTSPPQRPPSAPAAAAQTAGDAAVPVKIEVVRAPDALLQRLVEAGRPVQVTGTPAGSGPRGATILKTPLGEIAVKAPVTLPPSRPVTMQFPAPPPGMPPHVLGARTMPATMLLPASIATLAGVGPPGVPTPGVSPPPPVGAPPTVQPPTGPPPTALPSTVPPGSAVGGAVAGAAPLGQALSPALPPAPSPALAPLASPTAGQGATPSLGTPSGPVPGTAQGPAPGSVTQPAPGAGPPKGPSGRLGIATLLTAAAGSNDGTTGAPRLPTGPATPSAGAPAAPKGLPPAPSGAASGSPNAAGGTAASAAVSSAGARSPASSALAPAAAPAGTSAAPATATQPTAPTAPRPVSAAQPSASLPGAQVPGPTTLPSGVQPSTTVAVGRAPAVPQAAAPQAAAPPPTMPIGDQEAAARGGGDVPPARSSTARSVEQPVASGSRPSGASTVPSPSANAPSANTPASPPAVAAAAADTAASQATAGRQGSLPAQPAMNPAMTGAAAGSDGSAQVGTTPGPRPGQPALPVLGAYGPAPVPSGAAPGTISDTVREMLGVLTRLQSDPASTILRSVLPQPDGRLTAALLLFFQAVKGGDARSWLGERGAETLERAGRTDLLGRLSAELAQGAVRASDAAGNDWRLFTIPLFNEGAVEPIRVILRDKHAKQQSGEERGRDEPESRFLVDFTLTRTGPMQIDGSLRPNRFDTVLRSYHVLPRAIRTGAQACFVEACAASGLAGTMTFQTGAHTWIKVATQARAATTQA